MVKNSPEKSPQKTRVHNSLCLVVAAPRLNSRRDHSHTHTPTNIVRLRAESTQYIDAVYTAPQTRQQHRLALLRSVPPSSVAGAHGYLIPRRISVVFFLFFPLFVDPSRAKLGEYGTLLPRGEGRPGGGKSFFENSRPGGGG